MRRLKNRFRMSRLGIYRLCSLPLWQVLALEGNFCGTSNLKQSSIQINKLLGFWGENDSSSYP